MAAVVVTQDSAAAMLADLQGTPVDSVGVAQAVLSGEATSMAAPAASRVIAVGRDFPAPIPGGVTTFRINPSFTMVSGTGASVRTDSGIIATATVADSARAGAGVSAFRGGDRLTTILGGGARMISSSIRTTTTSTPSRMR